MKILVHDFAGHPFQVQLSSELARRGHSVLHAYFADIPGPKGALAAREGQPNLRIEAVRARRRFEAYSYWQRLRVHREYARSLIRTIREFGPDVVLSGNTPTDAQYLLSKECQRRNVPFIHWVQDFYALALQSLLARKLGVPAGKVCAFPFHLMERAIFRRSAAVVYISQDFAAYAARANYRAERGVVIENWASLGDLPTRAKDNAWARAHNLSGKFVFLYSGTMGLKHSPDSLLRLAERFKSCGDVRIVLVSQGIGRDVLERAKQEHQLHNLILLDFQPYEQLPEVLASADVLLASVEPDAGSFCVPSKILSYLCAGRAILISVPPQNLAARIIKRADAGFVCDPDAESELIDRAVTLYENKDRCAAMAQNARRYAESTFDIERIGTVFESLMGGENAVSETLSDEMPVGTFS
jgi:glycosyltransferase involved in cell wall biosynthesis